MHSVLDICKTHSTEDCYKHAIWKLLNKENKLLAPYGTGVNASPSLILPGLEEDTLKPGKQLLSTPEVY